MKFILLKIFIVFFCIQSNTYLYSQEKQEYKIKSDGEFEFIKAQIKKLGEFNVFRMNDSKALPRMYTDKKSVKEIIQDNILFKELIQESNYYVSDIVDYTQFTNKSGQKIIKESNFNITKLMSELFGKDKVPVIGKRQIKYNFNKVISDG